MDYAPYGNCGHCYCDFTLRGWNIVRNRECVVEILINQLDGEHRATLLFSRPI